MKRLVMSRLSMNENPDGDFIIRGLTGPVTDLTLKFHQDTGKGHRLVTGKPIASGTTQYCTRFA